MNLNEILKANGIEDELATKILSDMKANKVYTASEENLDIRYQKLKNEHSASAQTITDLQAQLAEVEKLKVQNVALVDEANKKLAEMQAENDKIKIDKETDFIIESVVRKHPDATILTLVLPCSYTFEIPEELPLCS